MPSYNQRSIFHLAPLFARRRQNTVQTFSTLHSFSTFLLLAKRKAAHCQKILAPFFILRGRITAQGGKYALENQPVQCYTTSNLIRKRDMQTVIPKPKSFSRSDETLSRKEPSFFCTGAERHFIIAEKEIYSESEPKNDMIYLPLSAAMLFNSPQGFISKQCNVKTEKPSAYIYAAVVATAAVLFLRCNQSENLNLPQAYFLFRCIFRFLYMRQSETYRQSAAARSRFLRLFISFH